MICIIYAFFSLSFVKLSTSFSTFGICILSTKSSSLLYFLQSSMRYSKSTSKKHPFFCFYQWTFFSTVKQLFFSSNRNPCVGSFWINAHSYRLLAFKYWRYVLVSSRFIELHVLFPILAFHWSNPTSNIFFKHQHISMFVSNSNLNLSGHSSHSLHVASYSQYSEAGFIKVYHAKSDAV